jgi:heat shock protein HslJ
MRLFSIRPLLVGITLLMGCTPPAASEGSPSTSLAAAAGAEWQLQELGGIAAPLGAGGRRATLVFSDSARAAGFAGCNRWFGTYSLDGTALRFGHIGMTRMACEEGMPLEQQLARALEATRTYRLNGNELILLDESGQVARFVRAMP